MVPQVPPPPSKQCPACGYTRTRLDPLPDTYCPECGLAYSQSQRHVELGLVKPLGEAQPRRSGSLKPAALALAAILVVASAWYFLLAPANAPEEAAATTAATLKGSIAAAASTQPQVVMFATSWCPYCAKARSFFRRHGIQYTERDIEKDSGGYAAYSKLGGGGVPVIVVGGRTVRGYNERELASLLGPWLDRHGG